MKTILMSATACLPNAGSEAGVGWNVATNMARFFKVVVFTRKSNKEKIDNYLQKYPIENLHFEYYDIPQFIRWIFFTKRKLFRNRALVYDFLWHLMAIHRFRKIARKTKAVLAHHVNQCQYRILSPCYSLNIPTVYGPLGGAETVSETFFQDLEQKTINKENKRKEGKDRKYFRFFQRICKGHKYFMFSCTENYTRLSPYVIRGNKCEIVPSIAYDECQFAGYKRVEVDVNKPFTLIYAGTLFDWKGVHLFLKAANKAFNEQSKIVIKLIGIRDTNDQQKVSSWIKETNIVGKIELIDFMPHDKLIESLSEADLFVYPAFRDSGAMAVLEACALGCPTICFDTGGQDVFPDNMMLKVQVGTSYQENCKNFADKLLYASEHRREIYVMGNQVQTYVKKNFTWKKKIEKFKNIYSLMLGKDEEI